MELHNEELVVLEEGNDETARGLVGCCSVSIMPLV